MWSECVGWPADKQAGTNTKFNAEWVWASLRKKGKTGHRAPAPAHLQLHPALLLSLPGFWSALTAQTGPSHLVTCSLIFSRYFSLEATSLLILDGQLTAGIPAENTARFPSYHLSDLGRTTSAFQTQEKWGARQSAVRRAEKMSTAGFPLKISVFSDSSLMRQG